MRDWKVEAWFRSIQLCEVDRDPGKGATVYCSNAECSDYVLSLPIFIFLGPWSSKAAFKCTWDWSPFDNGSPFPVTRIRHWAKAQYCYGSVQAWDLFRERRIDIGVIQRTETLLGIFGLLLGKVEAWLWPELDRLSGTELTDSVEERAVDRYGLK